MIENQRHFAEWQWITNKQIQIQNCSVLKISKKNFFIQQKCECVACRNDWPLLKNISSNFPKNDDKSKRLDKILKSKSKIQRKAPAEQLRWNFYSFGYRGKFYECEYQVRVYNISYVKSQIPEISRTPFNFLVIWKLFSTLIDCKIRKTYNLVAI